MAGRAGAGQRRLDGYVRDAYQFMLAAAVKTIMYSNDMCYS